MTVEPGRTARPLWSDPDRPRAARPFTIFEVGYWRGYLVHMRPYLLFVSGAAGLAGVAFAGTGGAVRGAATFACFFLAYGLGQALTDVFQTDTDAISSAYRPLIRGEVRGRDLLVTSLVALGAIGIFLAIENHWTIPFAVLSVAGLASYTFFKRRWWGGPFYNAWIVALIPPMAAMAAGGAGPGEAFGARGMPWLAGSIFFSYANFVLAGYLKDISADRATGYDTFPVRFGWGATAVVSDAFALLGLGAAAVFLATALPGRGALASAPALVALAGALGVSALAQAGVHRTRDERVVGRPIAHTVRSFVLGALALALACRPSFALAAALFYAAFEAVFARRPKERQV